MRAIWLPVCLTLMCSACELNPTKPQAPPSTQPIKREVRIEELRCDHVPAAPVPAQARATDASAAAIEEHALTTVVRELATRLGALWTCIQEHNARATPTKEKQ